MEIHLKINLSSNRKSGTLKRMPDFFNYIDNYIEHLFNEGRYSCFRNTKAFRRNLSQFVEGKSIDIRNISAQFIDDFRHFLSFSIGNSHNTIVEKLKVFSLLIDGYCAEYKVLSYHNPFDDYKISRKQTQRAFLTKEEIEIIMSLHLKENSNMALSRELFYIECFTGLRISDILCLKWNNYTGDSLSLTIRKTGQHISIPLTHRVKKIIESHRSLFSGGNDYIFPVLPIDVDCSSSIDSSKAIASATTLIDTHIKKIALRAGLSKKVTSHTGRHSFASMLIEEGATIFDIKELLGHQDVRVTQVYTHMVDVRKKNVMKMLDY